MFSESGFVLPCAGNTVIHSNDFVWHIFVADTILLYNRLSSRLLSKNLKIRIYKTIIMPIVLYGCETWSLILREEHSLRVFENRVLRRIFGQKRDEVTGDWKELHNEELHDLYPSPSIIRIIMSRRMRWVGHVARTGEKRNA
jgi:hypothetical protein